MLRFLAALVLACLVAGCGGNQPSAVQFRIAVIPKGLTHEHWQSVHRGAERAASDLTAQGFNTEILWDGPRKESDASDQINIMRTKASQGIQGMVLAPQNKDMVAQVEEIVGRGISVVLLDSGLDPAALAKKPDLIVKYVATDNYQGGRLAGKQLLDVLAKANVDQPRLVLFRYQAGSESTEQREQGFLDYLNEQKGKSKNFKLVSDETYAGATVDSASAQAGPLLARIGHEIDGIFAVNESATSGILNVLRSMKLNKRVHLVGFDQSEPLLQAVREGDVEGLIVQDPYKMGYLGVTVLVDHLRGQPIGGSGKNMSTGEYVLTAANLDDIATRERFDPELQKLRKIEIPK